MELLNENNIRKAGLLSSTGTAKTGIYQESAAKYGIEIVIPYEEGLKKQMEALFGKKGIKAGLQYERSAENKKLFTDVIEEFIKVNAQAAIMGCTEIPLCLEDKDTPMKLINPTEILAREAVKFALE